MDPELACRLHAFHAFHYASWTGRAHRWPVGRRLGAAVPAARPRGPAPRRLALAWLGRCRRRRADEQRQRRCQLAARPRHLHAAPPGRARAGRQTWLGTRVGLAARPRWRRRCRSAAQPAGRCRRVLLRRRAGPARAPRRSRRGGPGAWRCGRAAGRGGGRFAARGRGRGDGGPGARGQQGCERRLQQGQAGDLESDTHRGRLGRSTASCCADAQPGGRKRGEVRRQAPRGFCPLHEHLWCILCSFELPHASTTPSLPSRPPCNGTPHERNAPDSR